MQQLPILIILLVASPSLLARRCFQCDGIRPGGGLCEEGGLGNIGRQVECGEWNCGLLREERQILSSSNTLLASTYRWRRDCTMDAKMLVSSSGVEEEDLDYRDTGEPGCQYLQEFVYDNNDQHQNQVLIIITIVVNIISLTSSIFIFRIITILIITIKIVVIIVTIIIILITNVTSVTILMVTW